MNYEKPDIALVSSAVEAVKSQSNKEGFLPDIIHLFVTTPAYQSDE